MLLVVRTVEVLLFVGVFPGAINVCYPNDVQGHKVRLRIWEKIGMLITKWNDVPERTWEDVYSLVKELDV